MDEIILNFFEEIYGIKLMYNEIDTAHHDMQYSNIILTHSVYQLKYGKYFKVLFESITNYRKMVLLIFLNKDGKNSLKEIGFSKNDVNQLSLEFKNILLEQHESYLDYVKDQEESIIEKFLKKELE